MSTFRVIIMRIKEKMDERYKRISSELNVIWEEKEFSDKATILLKLHCGIPLKKLGETR